MGGGGGGEMQKHTTTALICKDNGYIPGNYDNDHRLVRDLIFFGGIGFVWRAHQIFNHSN